MRLDTIEAATADGVLRSIIISKGLDSPRALALDPGSGYVKEHERLKEQSKRLHYIKLLYNLIKNLPVQDQETKQKKV